MFSFLYSTGPFTTPATMPRCFLAKKSANETAQLPSYFSTASGDSKGEDIKTAERCSSVSTTMTAATVVGQKEGSVSDSGMSESGSSCNEEMEKAELEVTIKEEVDDEDEAQGNEDYQPSFPGSHSLTSPKPQVLRETATSTTNDDVDSQPKPPKKSVTIATQTSPNPQEEDETTQTTCLKRRRSVGVTTAFDASSVKKEDDSDVEEESIPKRHVLAAVVPQGPAVRPCPISVGEQKQAIALPHLPTCSNQSKTCIPTQAVTTAACTPFTVRQKQLSSSLGPSTTVSFASLTPTPVVSPAPVLPIQAKAATPFTTLTVVRHPGPAVTSLPFKEPISLVPLNVGQSALGTTMTAAGGATIHPILSSPPLPSSKRTGSSSVTIMPASVAAAAAASSTLMANGSSSSNQMPSVATLISLKSEPNTLPTLPNMSGHPEHKGKTTCLFCYFSLHCFLVNFLNIDCLWTNFQNEVLTFI